MTFLPVAARLRLAWAIYAHFAGLALISLGTAWMFVGLFETGQPVIELIGSVREVTPAVPAGGILSFTNDARRLQSCPGDMTIVFRSLEKHGPPAVVTLLRPIPASGLNPGEYYDRRNSFELPDAVFPGRWSFTSFAVSRCPTRIKTDPFVSFEFEVLPPAKRN